MPMDYLYAESNEDVPPKLIESCEAKASAYWNMFYQTNWDKFYKDRHYLDKEWAQLAHGVSTLLEVGCGAGNTVYPLLEVNPLLRIYACDFAPRAVHLVKEHPLYASGHVSAFVADLTRDDLCTHVPAASVDYATMVFVLSALSPKHMPAALANIARCLRVGGRLFFRDYADGDLAQERLQAAGAKRLGDRFYLRGDRTRCYYFQEPELVALFESVGFVCVESRTQDQAIENRKRDLIMNRRWVQAVFERKGHSADLDMSEAIPPSPQQEEASQGALLDLDFSSRTAPPLACGHGWFSGAAGRLASHTSALPGAPSGRALLPDSLESADECAGALSPDSRMRPGMRFRDADIEKALEAEFFATVQRKTQDVVSEELAVAGFAGISLAPPQLPPHPTSATRAESPPAVLLPPPFQQAAHQQQQQQQQATQPHQPVIDNVFISPNLNLSRHWNPSYSCHALCISQSAANEVLLARLCAHGPDVLRTLLANAQVLHIAAGPGALAGSTAVRMGAKRVLVTHPERACLQALASSLHENRSKLVIERLRVAQLVLGDSDMLQNAAEQAFQSSTSSNSWDEAGRQQTKALLCADLDTAVAAEVACLQQAGCKALGVIGANAATSDLGSQALTAVLQGAWQLTSHAPGSRKKLVHTVQSRASTLANKAAEEHVSYPTRFSKVNGNCSSVLLLFVRQGQEGDVATSAGASGWRVDMHVSAALLQSMLQQGLGGSLGLEGASMPIPMLLRSQL